MIQLLMLLVAAWLICGALAYSRTLAHFQRAWPRISDAEFYSDRSFALWTAAFGPAGLLTALALYRKHGWMWRWRKP